jgi:superoxide reductase
MNESPILGGVHTVDDIDAADDFHKKHIPFVSFTREGDVVTIEVEVGHYVSHPNLPDHWIDLIEIYANMGPIASFNFAAGVVAPKVIAHAMLDPGTKIDVTGRCNLHGIWLTKIEV